jgi:hypothetical protein
LLALVLARGARGIIGGQATRRHGMTSKNNDSGSHIFQNDDPEAFEAEFFDRMVASAAGLPRLCALKKCRRRKRCFGRYDGDLPCKRQHRGLAQSRFQSALKVLGWPNVNDDGTPIKR